jgi:hypothetical protein
MIAPTAPFTATGSRRAILARAVDARAVATLVGAKVLARSARRTIAERTFVVAPALTLGAKAAFLIVGAFLATLTLGAKGAFLAVGSFFTEGTFFATLAFIAKATFAA